MNTVTEEIRTELALMDEAHKRQLLEYVEQILEEERAAKASTV